MVRRLRQSLTPRRPSLRALAKLAAGIVTAALLVVATVTVVVAPAVDEIPDSLGYGLDEVPDLSEVTDQRRSISSVVTAADGSVIGRFRPERLHDPVSPTDLPSRVVTAVLAAEDADFFDHEGVDWVAVGRAAIRNLEAGEITQGGSTISQQLAKILFTTGAETFDRKLDELVIAQQLEREHTKEEILAAYLNTAFFGEAAVGIGAAADTYFRKDADQLTLSEAALLAGVIRAPSELNPRAAPEAAEARRLQVLRNAADADLVPATEVERALEQVPEIHPPRRAVVAHPFFLDYVRRWMMDEAGYSANQLFHGGLRIQATLDPAHQDAARVAVRRHLPDPAGPTAAVAVVDVNTGHVKAVVGGRSWDASEVNLALGEDGGGTGRQPGSSFKPFVLARVLEDGRSLKDLVKAPEEYIPDVEDPEPIHNYSQRGHGKVTIRDATRRSINTAFVNLTEQARAERVAELALRLGIESLPDPATVGPSIGIGSYETSPLEMATAYAAFTRNGRTLRPTPVARVTAPDGTVLEEHLGRFAGEQAIGPATARLVTSALWDVVESGTGTRATFGRPVAGKTGTSDEYQNAWFVGYTPQFASAVWVGHPEGQVSMRNVAGFARVTGGSIPALIWADVMYAVHQGLPVMGFPPAPDRPPSTTSTSSAPAAQDRED